jgi:hypothetical protein
MMTSMRRFAGTALFAGASTMIVAPVAAAHGATPAPALMTEGCPVDAVHDTFSGERSRW